MSGIQRREFFANQTVSIDPAADFIHYLHLHFYHRPCHRHCGICFFSEQSAKKPDQFLSGQFILPEGLHRFQA